MGSMVVPSMLDANLNGKVVLVRMDHNVVKNGKIKDTMRIDATIPTLIHIYKKGGLPVLMTHVGRPYDKKTGIVTISEKEAVEPIVRYLEYKLRLHGIIPEYNGLEGKGIVDLDSFHPAIDELRKGNCDLVYLPNTRWMAGEESKEADAEHLAEQLSALGDVFINDAFGSWQAHVSTFHLAKKLPAYAGLLMLKEIEHLQTLFEPKRPLVSVVAGAKFDTKIGPLSALIRMSDHLILGGVLYNAYLCVKYGIRIKGIGADDLALAKEFMEKSGEHIPKIVELPFVIESDSFDTVAEGSWRKRAIKDLTAGMELNFVLDTDPESFAEEQVRQVFAGAGTIFINAVMGYTVLFKEGTKAAYQLIDANAEALKLFGGGDTIQEFKDLLSDVFGKAVNNERYYFFTGGGAILDAIEKGSPYAMKPVQVLIENAGM